MGVIALFVAVDCTPELGLAPFFCNNGSPECPEGYRCVANGPIKVCVKEGASLGRDSTTPRPDLGPLDTRVDGNVVAKDSRGDSFKWPDASPPTDTNNPPPPDTGPVGDSTVDGPRIGSCQSNADCTSSSDPCCCPVFGLPIWSCLPFCLDPFCI